MASVHGGHGVSTPGGVRLYSQDVRARVDICGHAPTPVIAARACLAARGWRGGVRFVEGCGCMCISPRQVRVGTCGRFRACAHTRAMHISPCARTRALLAGQLRCYRSCRRAIALDSFRSTTATVRGRGQNAASAHSMQVFRRRPSAGHTCVYLRRLHERLSGMKGGSAFQVGAPLLLPEEGIGGE